MNTILLINLFGPEALAIYSFGILFFAILFAIKNGWLMKLLKRKNEN